MLEGFLDCILGDLIEGDPVALLVLKRKCRIQMPADSLSLTLRVGCKIDIICLFYFFSKG